MILRVVSQKNHAGAGYPPYIRWPQRLLRHIFPASDGAATLVQSGTAVLNPEAADSSFQPSSRSSERLYPSALSLPHVQVTVQEAV